MTYGGEKNTALTHIMAYKGHPEPSQRACNGRFYRTDVGTHDTVCGRDNVELCGRNDCYIRVGVGATVQNRFDPRNLQKGVSRDISRYPR
jgi:hypothetical protein